MAYAPHQNDRSNFDILQINSVKLSTHEMKYAIHSIKAIT